jgi:hypothetical protein
VAVFAPHRLRAAGREIDDREACVREDVPVAAENPLIIRAAMHEGAHGRLGVERPLGGREDCSEDTAHEESNLTAGFAERAGRGITPRLGAQKETRSA